MDKEIDRLEEIKALESEIERLAKLLEEAEADKRFLDERLKLRDDENEKLRGCIEGAILTLNDFKRYDKCPHCSEDGRGRGGAAPLKEG